MRNTQLTDQCLTKLPKLVDLVLEEHECQIEERGVLTCTSFEWVEYLQGELGELKVAVYDYKHHRDGKASTVVQEAIQVATLCLKIAEMYMDLEDKDG